MELERRKRRLRAWAVAQRAERVDLAAAERVAEAVAALSVFRSARRVVLYAELPGELSTAPIRARSGGRPLLWPRVRGERLSFAESAPESLVKGRFGIPEPPGSEEEAALAEGDLVVVPGLAFDREGRRLGRGHGYYDRAIDAYPGPVWVAVGYDWQLVERVPAGPGDRGVDWIVTDSTTWRVTPERTRRG